MGRPSKLTDKQWAEIKARLLAGEKAADLAREFKVSPTAVSNRVSKRIETVKAVANQMVSAKRAMSELSDSEQEITNELVNDLMAVQNHMIKGAKYASASWHRLSAIANGQLEKVDDAEPMKSTDILKAHAVLQKLANEAAIVPAGLMNAQANREVLRAAREDGDSIKPVKIVVQVEDASRPESTP